MRKIGALVGVLLLLSGCTWWDYEPASVFQNTQIGGCPGIGTQNLDPSDADTILQAATAACRTINSPEFARRLKNLELREACDTEVRISGPEVLQLLRSGLPDHSIIARKPWRAEAVTDPANRRIAIRKQRFKAWRSGGTSGGALVNTLVHEWTHLVLDANGFVRFRDRGHTGSKQGCPQNGLVSYRVGNIAQEVWHSEVASQ